VRSTIAAGAELLLRHHVHRRTHDLSRDSKPGWRRFGFPLMYQTDALEILLILTRLGREEAVAAGGAGAGARPDGASGAPILGDERLREALDLVASKADAQGRWTLQSTFNDRFVVPIETKGEPSRWVTMRALEALRAATPRRLQRRRSFPSRSTLLPTVPSEGEPSRGTMAAMIGTAGEARGRWTTRTLLGPPLMAILVLPLCAVATPAAGSRPSAGRRRPTSPPWMPRRER